MTPARRHHNSRHQARRPRPVHPLVGLGLPVMPRRDPAGCAMRSTEPECGSPTLEPAVLSEEAELLGRLMETLRGRPEAATVEVAFGLLRHLTQRSLREAETRWSSLG